MPDIEQLISNITNNTSLKNLRGSIASQLCLFWIPKEFKKDADYTDIINEAFRITDQILSKL